MVSYLRRRGVLFEAKLEHRGRLDGMIGSGAVEIDGIRAGGRREPMFRKVEWANQTRPCPQRLMRWGAGCVGER